VRDLGLEDRLLMTSKNSAAAQNRFIYYPDHLVRMPGPGTSLFNNLSNIWSEPVFEGVIPGILTEVVKPTRPDDLQDESIGSFLARRFGSSMTDNIVSAVFHGVYAGDIYKLSARSILPEIWQLERRHNSIMKGVLSQVFGDPQPIAANDLDVVMDYQKQPPMSRLLEAAKRSSVFTFKGGIGDLAARLEAKLQENRNVKIKRKTLAKDLILKTGAAIPKVGMHSYYFIPGSIS